MRLPASLPLTRLSLAARSAVAAVLAWYAAGLVPGTDDYRFYAPLGAVIVTYPTVVDTVSSTWRSLLAVTAGGLLGAACLLLPDFYGLTLLVAVGGGVLLGGLRVFGSQRAWVPTAALFTLVVGAGDPVEYLAAYAGLVLLGALIGTGVGLLAPSLPRGRADRSGRSALVGVALLLDDLAEDVESGGRSRPVTDRVDAVRAGLADAAAAAAVSQKASRGNLRTARHGEELAREARTLHGVERVCVVAVDLADHLSDDEEVAALGADGVLAARTGSALRAVSRAVAPGSDVAPREVLLDRAREAVRDLAAAVRERVVAEQGAPAAGDAGPTGGVDPVPVASGTITHLRRVLAGLDVASGVLPAGVPR